MKCFFVFQILLLAIVAMASSQVNVVDNNNPGKVNFVDNPEPVRVVEQPEQGIVDPGFYRPSAGNNNNGGIVDPGFYQPGAGGGNNGGGIVEDTAFYRPSVNNPGPPSYPVITNPDPGFYLPSHPNAQSSLDPTFVDSAFYRPSDPNAQSSLDPTIVDSAFYRPSDLISNPDQAFYRPSAGGQGNVQYQNKPPGYPGKHYDFPGARGGK